MPSDRGSFSGKLLATAAVTLSVVLLLYLLFKAAQVLLVLFAAILGSLFLDGIARPLQKFPGLPRTPAILLVSALLVAAIAGFALALGPQLLDQSADLVDLVSDSLSRFRDWIESKRLSGIFSETSRAQLTAIPAELFKQLSGAFSSVFGFFTAAVIVTILAVYLAIQPAPYVNGVLALLPPRHRKRGREVLDALGQALRWWLVGRALSMAAVSVLTLIGLWIIGLPAALALAAIAGLFSFVPYFGPIVATFPALLISLGSLPWAPIWVLVVYSIVQFLEGNFITPIVQQRAVSLPPVVLVVAQLAGGVLFGLLGILLATPLAVVAIVLVQMLYVQGVLGEGVKVLGDHRDTK